MIMKVSKMLDEWYLWDAVAASIDRIIGRYTSNLATLCNVAARAARHFMSKNHTCSRSRHSAWRL